MEKFKEPILVTRPMIPNLESTWEQIKEVFQSRWLTNFGDKHHLLESKLKDYLNVKHLSLFNNGTSALMLALKALDLKGEVITTPFTFPATVQALDWNGLTPVFCDIDENDLNIDPQKIEPLITEKTSAILPVHVFGNPCQVEAIAEIAKKYNLKVIYDGAHVFGVRVNGVPIGHFGDMTMFSFHATKLFNTIEGGGVAFHHEGYYEKLKWLKNFGLSGPESVEVSGLNAKLNEIQSAIGLENLKIIEEERRRREVVRQTYENGLRDIEGIRIITNRRGEECSYQYFVIEIDPNIYRLNRDELHEKLKEYNVFTRKYFYPLCSDFKDYAHLPTTKAEHLPVAKSKAERVLAMPFYGDLDVAAVEKICELIKMIGS